MTLNEIKQILETDKRYEFLRTNPYLGENIIVLAIGGSYAYGTNAASSDLDIRGITCNTEREILLGQDIEQVVSHETDTTIYTFKKMIKLLCSNNPAVIEILGLKPEHYLYKQYTDLCAFIECLRRFKANWYAWVEECDELRNTTVAIPYKIGCGRGGADWENDIYPIIKRELADYNVELWRYEE